MTEQPLTVFRSNRFALGLVLALAGHALAFGLAFVAARVVEPSEGGGFEDIAAVALTFLGVEALVALAVMVFGVILTLRGRRDLGIGLFVGWLIGLAGVVLLIRINGSS